MKFQDLFQEIERGKILPLYYLYGPEKWLIDEAVGQIKKKILSPSTADFNYQAFDGTSDSAEAILESLQVFPVQSPRRLVLVRQADTLGKEQSDAFKEYLEDPNPSTCAIFLGEKADLRTQFFQRLERKGAVISFYPLPERELFRWVGRKVEELGGQISEEGLSALIDQVGPSLQDLYLEIQKLILPVGRRKIQREDVEALTDDTCFSSPFELPRAVVYGNLSVILRRVRKNLQQGDPPLLLFSLVIRQIRRIQKAKEMRAAGGSKKEIEGKLKILPRNAEDFWVQAERFPSSDFAGLWWSSLETDQGLKTSRLDKGLQLERFLFNLYFLLHGPNRHHGRG